MLKSYILNEMKTENMFTSRGSSHLVCHQTGYHLMWDEPPMLPSLP